MRSDLPAIIRAGIAASDAGALTARGLEANRVLAGDGSPVVLVAAGKAAPRMAHAAVEQLGARVAHGLVVSATREAVDSRLELIVGGHPVPTEGSEAAGRRALALATSRRGQRLLVLISGGASALLAVPAEGVTLDDKRRTTDRLLHAGADIHALNTVRKHLSAIKGGWLAAAAGECVALAVSDVVGDDLSVIASGPTVADATTFDDALGVLKRFGGESAFPAAVVRRLRDGAAGRHAETPKPGDPRLAGAVTGVIGSRRNAMDGAAAEAAARGYRVLRLDDAVVGEARRASASHVRACLARARDLPRPACIVSSGETTVQVRGRGKGGRNQEFALAAAPLLEAEGAPAALASAGTDGIDGPTDAAGGAADSTTAARASAAGLDPARFLDDNDAYTLLDRLGDLIRTGPTGTNVGDLQVLLLS
ncbi:MAG TPA: DUF4147 domain-containing protein [Vicinamibacterales bacterium]|nr:DUF4147 domain-containing protein [Vicinamibacterales bacterium]